MIEIIDFSNVKVDGANVGDCISAVANYPDRAGAILAALATYEAGLVAAAVPAPVEATIDPGQITELNAMIGQLQQTIEQQQNQLSQLVITDWPGLQTALLDAGLSALIAEIVTIARNTPNPPGQNLETEVLLLISRADAAVKRSDRIGVIESYQALLGHPTTGAGFVPKLLGINPQTAPGLMGLIQSTMPILQAVLDDRNIPKNLLKFVD